MLEFWEYLAVLAAVTALIVGWIWFVRRCRKDDEPNMHNWRGDDD